MGRPDLVIDRAAPTERRLLGDGSSWVDLTPGFLPAAGEVLAELLDVVTWQQTEVWRYERYVPEQRLGAWLPAETLPPAFRQTGLHLDARYGVRFEGVSVVQYRDGADHQGLHRDREMKWLDETLVGILVLGARRPFVLRPRVSRPGGTVAAERVRPGSGEGDVVLTPGEGDLLVMGGRAQRDWLHGVPSAAGMNAPRVSVIWRWTSRRGRPDTGPSYYDGSHFSDRPRRPATRFRAD